MALFEYNPDVLDAAYNSETQNMDEHELTAHSRLWHEKILRLSALEASSPSRFSLQRIDALRQIYMFYLIKQSFTPVGATA